MCRVRCFGVALGVAACTQWKKSIQKSVALLNIQANINGNLKKCNGVSAPVPSGKTYNRKICADKDYHIFKTANRGPFFSKATL